MGTNVHDNFKIIVLTGKNVYQKHPFTHNYFLFFYC